MPRFEPRKLEWAAAALLGLLALWSHALRFVHAGALWRDEAALVGYANLPSLGLVWRLFPRESFPMPVVALLRLVTEAAGPSDQALRGFGMAVGLAVAAALWLAARSAGRNLPLLSLALVGGNAAFVVFGDSIRGYGLGSLFIVLAFAALWRLLARPGPLPAAASLLAAVGAVQSLFGNLALVAALCAAAAVAALWSGRRRVAAAVAAIGIAAALSLLPYAAPMRQARSWTVLVSHPIDPWQIVSVLAAVLGPAAPLWLLLVGLALVGVARRLAARRRRAAAPVPASISALPAAASPAPDPAAAAPPAPGPPDRHDDALRLFAALAIVLGIAAHLLFLAWLSYTPRAWYDLPLLALAGAALEPLLADLCRTRSLRRARAVLALGVAAALLLSGLPRLRMRMTNADLVARRLALMASGGDLVVVSPWHYGISFDRYVRGPAGWMTLPQLSDHRMHRYDLLKERLAAPRPIDDVLAGARRALAGGHRVWLVGELRIPPAGRPPPVVPPAPATPWGWDDLPYGISWELQLGALLRDHAASLRPVPVPSADPISPLETMRLAVAAGWRG
ncbi:MAG: hypothetical protein JOZ15_08205 [Acidobacteria bacterium]|nr:hypothetical protein [Acidobacteriota bacterium]